MKKEYPTHRVMQEPNGIERIQAVFKENPDKVYNADNIFPLVDLVRDSVAEYLSDLSTEGFLDRVKRGHYRINKDWLEMYGKQ